MVCVKVRAPKNGCLRIRISLHKRVTRILEGGDVSVFRSLVDLTRNDEATRAFGKLMVGKLVKECDNKYLEGKVTCKSRQQTWAGHFFEMDKHGQTGMKTTVDLTKLTIEVDPRYGLPSLWTDPLEEDEAKRKMYTEVARLLKANHEA